MQELTRKGEASEKSLQCGKKGSTLNLLYTSIPLWYVKISQAKNKMVGGFEVETFEKHCFVTDKCETELSEMTQNIYIHAEYITKYMTLLKKELLCAFCIDGCFVSMHVCTSE